MFPLSRYPEEDIKVAGCLPCLLLVAGSGSGLSDTDKAYLQKAFSIAKASGLSDAGALLAAGQGWTESYLGTKGQFVKPDGEPSWNWGAVTARGGVPCSFKGHDTSEGKTITQTWACFDSMEDGFTYWANIGSIKAALGYMNAGDAIGVAAALFDRGYYTGFPTAFEKGSPEDREARIKAYAAMLMGGAAIVSSATGIPNTATAGNPVPSNTGVPPKFTIQPLKKGASGGSIVLGGLFLAGAYWLWKNPPFR